MPYYNVQYIKGSSCKLQRPSQRPRPPNVALEERDLWNNNSSKYSGIKITRGKANKKWEVMFGHDVWNENETDSNSRGADFRDSQTTLAKLNAAIHRPTARSYDEFTLLHGQVNIGKQKWSRVSDHIIASGLSDFTGSARFNSSRLKSSQLLGPYSCPLQETCRICSAVAKLNPTESVVERTPKSTFPDVTDILLERADTWRNKSPPNGIDLNDSLTKAPKAFQPKSWQSYKPEFTQPYRFTYFLDNNHDS